MKRDKTPKLVRDTTDNKQLRESARRSAAQTDKQNLNEDSAGDVPDSVAVTVPGSKKRTESSKAPKAGGLNFYDQPSSSNDVVDFTNTNSLEQE